MAEEEKKEETPASSDDGQGGTEESKEDKKDVEVPEKFKKILPLPVTLFRVLGDPLERRDAFDV